MPQYAAVLPHHPLELQQFPNPDPWQVNALVPPHVASVDTFFVAVGAAEVDVLVDEATTTEDARVEDATTVEELTTVPLHVPKAALQPVPQ